MIAVAIMSINICLKILSYGIVIMACTFDELSSFIGIGCVLIMPNRLTFPLCVVSTIFPFFIFSIYKSVFILCSKSISLKIESRRLILLVMPYVPKLSNK